MTSGSPLTPETAWNELRTFESLIKESHELDEALATPAVPASRKKAIIGRLGDSVGLSPIMRNFLFVLIDHRRTRSLPDIVVAFQADRKSVV